MIPTAGTGLRLPSMLSRLVLCVALSAALMVLDHRGNHLAQIRVALGVLLYPVQLLAVVPTRVGGAIIDFVRGDAALREEVARRRTEEPLLLARVQKLEALEAENRHLRSLLDSAPRAADRAIVAEILEVSLEPFARRLVLDKGTGQGLYDGQPVIDAYGVMGQVIEAGPLTSRAMLITDPAHAIPVQVTRNGLRTIVFGTGQHDRVAVRYLTAISDIKIGDLLVTSGMGGTFPANYPVAQVVRIVNNPNESFLDIEAQPVARLNHNREALLIWPGSKLVPTALPTEKPKPAPAKPAPVAKPPAPKPAAPVAAPAPTTPASADPAPTPATPATPPPASTP